MADLAAARRLRLCAFAALLIVAPATPGFAVTISNLQARTVTTRSAIIRWTTDVATTSQVDFGATTAYGQTRTDPESVTDHYVWIGGLPTGATTHFRVSGGGAISGDQTLQTYASVAALVAASPILTISFDDGGPTDRTGAWPLMRARNMRGQCNVYPSRAATDSTREPDWLYLRDKGWDIMSHSMTHLYHPGKTQTQQMKEMVQSRDWLVAHGFGGPDGKVLSYRYPGSHGTYYSESIAEGLGYRLRWGNIPPSEGTPVYPPFYLTLPLQAGFYSCYSWFKPTTTSLTDYTNTFLGHVDSAYNQGRFVHIQMHRIQNGTAQVDCPPANFAQILDRCVLRGFTVLPVSEIYDDGGAPPTPPGTPTGLQATATSSSTINVVWNASSGATDYNLERRPTSGGSYVPIGGTITGTSYLDSGLSANTSYTYHVRAHNSAGYSGFSAEASATTQAGGGGPTVLNPGFESAIGSEWTLPGVFTRLTDVTFAHAGNNSLRAITTSGYNEAYQDIAATVGQAYTVRCWIRVASVSGGNGFALGYYFVNGSGARLGNIYYANQTTTTGYVQKTLTTTNAPANTVSLRIFAATRSTSGTAYFDDFTVTAP